jgi:hypothetical protein
MTPLAWIGDALWSLIPMAGVGLIVWIVFRAIVRADAKERKVYSEIEAEERAKRDLPLSEQPAKKGK